jgi:hypothetical protein
MIALGLCIFAVYILLSGRNYKKDRTQLSITTSRKNKEEEAMMMMTRPR